MEEYLELAKQTQVIDNFDIDKLKQAIIFSDEKNHITSGSYPGLIWCGYERDDNEEMRKDFASGNSMYDSAEIRGETYWIVDGKYIIGKSNRDYSFSCQGHCGGVEEYKLHKKEMKFYNWIDGEKIKPDEKFREIMEFITQIVSTSRHERMELNNELDGIFGDEEFDSFDEHIGIDFYQRLEDIYVWC